MIEITTIYAVAGDIMITFGSANALYHLAPLKGVIVMLVSKHLTDPYGRHSGTTVELYIFLNYTFLIYSNKFVSGKSSQL
jgi:hypothetical protein